MSDVGDRTRERGGGSTHKNASYEWAVLEFHDSCLHDDGVVRKAGAFNDYSKIDEFAALNISTQRAWVARFMKCYDPKNRSGKQQEVAGSNVEPQQEIVKSVRAENKRCGEGRYCGGGWKGEFRVETEGKCVKPLEADIPVLIVDDDGSGDLQSNGGDVGETSSGYKLR